MDHTIFFTVEYEAENPFDEQIPIVDSTILNYLYDPESIAVNSKEIYVEFIFPDGGDPKIECIRSPAPLITKRFLLKSIIDYYVQYCERKYDDTAEFANVFLLDLYKLPGEYFYKMNLNIF